MQLNRAFALCRPWGGISVLLITWSPSPVKDRWGGSWVPSELGIKKQLDSLAHPVQRRLFDQNQQCKYHVSFWREAKLSSYPFLPHPIPYMYVPKSFLSNLRHPQSHRRKLNLCKRDLELGSGGDMSQGPGHRAACTRRFPSQTTGSEPTPSLGCGPCTCEPTRALRAPCLWLGRENPQVSKWWLPVASCDQREANFYIKNGAVKADSSELVTYFCRKWPLALCKLAIPFQTASEDFQYLTWTYSSSNTSQFSPLCTVPPKHTVASEKDSVYWQLPSSPSSFGYGSWKPEREGH